VSHRLPPGRGCVSTGCHRASEGGRRPGPYQPTGVPQSRQNLAPGASGLPHAEHDADAAGSAGCPSVGAGTTGAGTGGAGCAGAGCAGAGTGGAGCADASGLGAGAATAWPQPGIAPGAVGCAVAWGCAGEVPAAWAWAAAAAAAAAAATAAAPTGWPHFGHAIQDGSSTGARQLPQRAGVNGSCRPHAGHATTSRLM
jgi:hypothetical protein